MHNPDYLPSRDIIFKLWIINFLGNLFPSLARYGFPVATFDSLQELSNKFIERLELSDTPTTRTKGAVLAKNDARKELTKAVRQAVRQWLANNPAVTNADRENLGLPVYKIGRKPTPVAATYPHFEVDSGMIRRLIIHFCDQNRGRSKAKPAGQHGVEIRWAILDNPPVNITDLLNTSLATRTPFMLEFEGHDRGKTVYFCLCWENTRGKKGPWSIIGSAIIP